MRGGYIRELSGLGAKRSAGIRQAKREVLGRGAEMCLGTLSRTREQRGMRLRK